MLPEDSGIDGWIPEIFSTELLYPRNGIKDKFKSYTNLYSTKEVCTGIMAPKTGYLQVFNAAGDVIFTGSYPYAKCFDFAFDQLDRIFLTWELPNDEVWIYYYDSITSDMVTKLVAVGNNPCCCMDELRTVLGYTSDIMLFYQQADLVFNRQQRDRYDIAYPVPHTHTDVVLETVGMGTNLRLTVRTISTDALVIKAGEQFVGVDNNYVGLTWGELPWDKN